MFPGRCQRHPGINGRQRRQNCSRPLSARCLIRLAISRTPVLAVSHSELAHFTTVPPAICRVIDFGMRARVAPVFPFPRFKTQGMIDT